jgi:protease-4
MRFKRKTRKAVVVSMMDMAASGAYMISLPADEITAHPTTVTGSVGVIFMRPQVSGLMEKIGLGMDVTKSGKNKDMGSPFRSSTKEEEQLFQHLIDRLNARFMTLVKTHRKLTKKQIEEISTARIFIAEDALKVGLIDKICYIEEAISDAKKIAGIPADARVVVYRRIHYPNDNIYNTSVSHYGGSKVSLINSDFFNLLNSAHTGFFALWPGAVGAD